MGSVVFRLSDKIENLNGMRDCMYALYCAVSIFDSVFVCLLVLLSQELLRNNHL